MNIINIDQWHFPSGGQACPALYGDRRDFLKASLALAIATLFGGGMAKAGKVLKIVALGDSLTAGYNLPADAAFPSQLEKALKGAGFDVQVVNAGVSGDTTADGLARLDWSFGEGADAAIVELGANDMLRGLDPAIPRRNLEAIFDKLKARKIPFLIAGMAATPSYGDDYRKAFDPIYPQLAQKYGAPLYPFFLDGVMGVKGMQLQDGLHPTREGVAHIVDAMLPMVEAFLKSLPTAG